MNRIILIAGLLMLTAVTGKAQHSVTPHLVSRVPMLLNPAGMQFDDNLYAAFNYRSNFSGMDGNPRSLNLALSGTFRENIGLVAGIRQNSQGVFNDFEGHLAGVYALTMPGDHAFKFALNAGIMATKLDLSGLESNGRNYQADPVLLERMNYERRYISGLGMTYHNNNLSLGASLPLLIFSSEEMERRGYITASYKVAIQEDIFDLTFFALHQTIQGSKNQTDLNLQAEWKKMLWAQAGYRTNHSLNIGFGVQVKEFGFGYSHDFIRNGLQQFGSYNQEIVVTYRINTSGNN